MTYKSLKILLSVQMLLFSGFLFITQSAYSAPVALEDSAMDQVTAGNTKQSGGIVVGKSSESIINSTTGLTLSAEAQQAAKGLNLVNSTDSAVANTVNIWAGSIVSIKVEDGDVKPVLEVNQINQVTQEQNRTATLTGYLRPESEQTEIFNRSGSESYLSKIVNSNNTTNLLEESRLSFTTSSTNVNTRTKFNIGDKLYFEGNLGQGVAVAGHADIDFDGGSADIALVVGGGISAGADSADVTGTINVADLDFGDTGAAAGISAEVKISLLTNITFPTMNIVIEGAGCGVVMGSCNATSMIEEFTNTKTDNSTQDIVENHQSGQSVFSEQHTEIYRSAFELKSASAEYIVVDDSSLILTSDVSLELSDSSQKEIEGMNIVNAIGSNVANSTNVSRASEFKSRRSTLVLNQFNIVHHGN